MELGHIKDIHRMKHSRKLPNDNFGSLDNEDMDDDFDFVDATTDDEIDLGTITPDDEIDFDMQSDDNSLQSLLQRLRDVQSEISDILSHFDVESDDFDMYDDYDDYADDENFDIDDGLDDDFGFDDKFGDDFDDEEDYSALDDFDSQFSDESNDFDVPEEDDEDFLDQGEEISPNTEDDFSFGSDFADEEVEEDPDFQGNIRNVAGANLVYKRRKEDGNYEELWIYNIGDDIKEESRIRRAILAGTDIPPTSITSPDGEQTSKTESVGNVQFLLINGLPN